MQGDRPFDCRHSVAPRTGEVRGRPRRPQYRACEPENRLDAREIERLWNEALEQQRQLDGDFERWQRAAPPRPTDEDAQAIRALAADLPALWHADTTAAADRRRIARLLLDRVTVNVDVDKTSERPDIALLWVGGSTQAHAIRRTVNRYDQQRDYPKLVERLRSLGEDRLTAAAIAARLNAEGFRPPRGWGLASRRFFPRSPPPLRRW